MPNMYTTSLSNNIQNFDRLEPSKFTRSISYLDWDVHLYMNTSSTKMVFTKNMVQYYLNVW